MGIFDDVVALGILTGDGVRAALGYYTRRRLMYQRVLADGGVRVDLHGAELGR